MGASRNWTCSPAWVVAGALPGGERAGPGRHRQVGAGDAADAPGGEEFEVVIWRSLRDVPSCEALLDDCLQVLAPQALRDIPLASKDARTSCGMLAQASVSCWSVTTWRSFLEEGEDTRSHACRL